jgi:hypothetical protein
VARAFLWKENAARSMFAKKKERRERKQFLCPAGWYLSIINPGREFQLIPAVFCLT